jgi:hypothetical protein
MTLSEKVKLVAKVLKKYQNLTNEEAIVLAHRIIEVLDKVNKVEIN